MSSGSLPFCAERVFVMVKSSVAETVNSAPVLVVIGKDVTFANFVRSPLPILPLSPLDNMYFI